MTIEGSIRDLLISLHASRLPRQAISRLARRLSKWCDRSPTPQLARTIGVSSATLKRVQEIRRDAPRRAEEASRQARSEDARIVTWLDDDYPKALFAAEDPPPVIHVQGQLPGGTGVGIVGARGADTAGLKLAKSLSRRLTQAGLTIVSGSARGIDEAAHRACVDAQGRSIAVLGCGVDRPYPRGQERLREDLVIRGARLSELPIGTRPRPEHFPRRNRLIAALSAAVVVVQAARRSGAILTARLAAELGREVFAVPGRIDDPLSAGCNHLIRDGALLALGADDLLQSLELAGIYTAPQQGPAHRRRALERSRPRIPETARPLLEALGHQGRTIEWLAEKTGHPVAQLQSTLLEFELSGLVERLVGGTYRAHPALGLADESRVVS